VRDLLRSSGIDFVRHRDARRTIESRGRDGARAEPTSVGINSRTQGSECSRSRAQPPTPSRSALHKDYPRRPYREPAMVTASSSARHHQYAAAQNGKKTGRRQSVWLGRRGRPDSRVFTLLVSWVRSAELWVCVSTASCMERQNRGHADGRWKAVYGEDRQAHARDVIAAPILSSAVRANVIKAPDMAATATTAGPIP